MGVVVLVVVVATTVVKIGIDSFLYACIYSLMCG